jgi:hypothetical protein
LFVDDSDRLLEFLREAIQSKHLQPSWPSIFPTLLELLLRQYHKSPGRVLEQEMMRLLKEHCITHDASTSALTLCKCYEFNDGFVFICEQMGNFQLLMSYFMDKKDVPKLLEVCEKYVFPF